MTQLDCRSLRFSTPSWSCEYTASFRSGHWHVITGESGSGKSTLLRLLCGLLTADAGDILMNDESISPRPPHERKISYMSQASSLFPGITIFENLMLALHDDKASTHIKTAKIRALAATLKLDESILARVPSAVSGGQLSRANLARSLLRPCSWLLLDEPFAAVDRQTRLSILNSLREWRADTNTGILLVSHDLDDIFTVATDVTVISDGNVIENSPLRDALDSPRCLTTARLLRSGLTAMTSSGPIFLRPDHLHTAPDQVPCDNQHLGSVVLGAAQATRIGSSLRIIDLNDGSDVTLSTQSEFSGTLWFDKRNANSIKLR